MASTANELLALLERAAAELKATHEKLEAEKKAHARTRAELAALPVGQDITKPGVAALYGDDEITASGVGPRALGTGAHPKAAADTARMRPPRPSATETVEGQSLQHLARIGELEEALASAQARLAVLEGTVAELTGERDGLRAQLDTVATRPTPAPGDGRIAELEALLQREFEKTQGLATKLAEARARLKALESSPSE